MNNSWPISIPRLSASKPKPSSDRGSPISASAPAKPNPWSTPNTLAIATGYGCQSYADADAPGIETESEVANADGRKSTHHWSSAGLMRDPEKWQSSYWQYRTFSLASVNDRVWVGSCRTYNVDWNSIHVHIRPDQANNFGGSAGGTIDHFGSDGLYKTIR
jgi:hypothetical protein